VPGAVGGHPRIEVIGVAEVVASVAVGALEVQQVLGRPLGYADVLWKSSQTAVRRGD
jgi:hypothetical protein